MESVQLEKGPMRTQHRGPFGPVLRAILAILQKLFGNNDRKDQDSGDFFFFFIKFKIYCRTFKFIHSTNAH